MPRLDGSTPSSRKRGRQGWEYALRSGALPFFVKREDIVNYLSKVPVCDEFIPYHYKLHLTFLQGCDIISYLTNLCQSRRIL